MATLYEFLESKGGHWKGANNFFIGVDGEENYLYGDVTDTLYDSAKGGKDILIGGANSGANVLYGDAYSMYESAKGGDDTLTAADSALANCTAMLFA